MMRPSDDIDHVWLAREPQDFRKGINGLSIVVEEQLRHDPFSGQLFVFINKARDKIKVLYWGVPRTFVVKPNDAVVKMRVGPSESPFRRRLQTTHCCCAQKTWW